MALDGFEDMAGADIIVQADPVAGATLHCVPVYVEGPVETRELASRFGTLRSFTLNASSGTAVKIAGHDPRRRTLRLIALDATGACLSVALGATKNEAELGQPFLLPLVKAGVPSTSQTLQLTGTGELWARGDANGGCVLSVASESWI
jgi:hypothetical protein